MELVEGEICFTPNARTISKRLEKGADRRPGRVPSRDFNGIVNSIASGELWSIFAGVGRVTSFHPRPLTHGHDGCRPYLLSPLISCSSRSYVGAQANSGVASGPFPRTLFAYFLARFPSIPAINSGNPLLKAKILKQPLLKLLFAGNRVTRFVETFNKSAGTSL